MFLIFWKKKKKMLTSMSISQQQQQQQQQQQVGQVGGDQLQHVLSSGRQTNAPARGSMLRPSLRRTPESAPIKDSAGLPWGCCIMPLSPGEVSDSRALETILADQVPRCTECFGYINVYCMFEKKAWICSLCGCKNDLSQRYASSTQRSTSI